MDNWVPGVVTADTGGVEVQQLSFLGAFMGLSTFAEDTVSMLRCCIALLVVR